MKTTRILIALFTFALLLFLVGCSNTPSADQTTGQQETVSEASSESVSETTAPDIEKIKIVSTLFPQFDFAKIIGGEFVDVTLLLPPGVESHSYEPTPKDIIMIESSDLFLFTSELMEPWTHSILESTSLSSEAIIDLSVGITLLKASEDHDHEEGEAHEEGEEHKEGEEHEEGEAHEHGEYDPHYWTDPNNAIIMVETIKNALIAEMPEYATTFEANASALTESLKEIDAALLHVATNSKSKTILSGGHFAFGYMADQYGFEHLSPYAGFSPDAEPTPQRIADLIETVETTGVNAIFYEELVDPKVSKIISEEAGVEMLLLHGAHNVSKDELAQGVSYVELMKMNIENLKKGLNYNE